MVARAERQKRLFDFCEDSEIFVRVRTPKVLQNIFCFVLTIVFDACALFVAERKERAYYERVYYERDYARKRKTFTMREQELLGGFYSRKSK